MARKFTRKKWRRPQRMTLEGPVGVRRKDLVVPEFLALESDEVRPTNRRHTMLMLTLFVLLAAIEGLLLAFASGPAWLPIATAGLALLYLAAARSWGDDWMRSVLKSEPSEHPRARNIIDGLARAAGMPPPDLLHVAGNAPNATSVGLHKPAIVLTDAAMELGPIELEALIAREIIRVRDGDAKAASWLCAVCGAMELRTKGLGSPYGFVAWLTLPLWPAELVLRGLGRKFAPAHERRTDIAAALLTRYPPGMRGALEAAAVEQSDSPLRATDPYWTAPRIPGSTKAIEDRIDAIAEL